MVDQIDVVSYDLQSLWDAIELTTLCAFICILGYSLILGLGDSNTQVGALTKWPLME